MSQNFNVEQLEIRVGCRESLTRGRFHCTLPKARHQFSDLKQKLCIIVSKSYMIKIRSLFKSWITNASCFGIFLVLNSYLEIHASLRFVLRNDKVWYPRSVLKALKSCSASSSPSHRKHRLNYQLLLKIPKFVLKLIKGWCQLNLKIQQLDHENLWYGKSASPSVVTCLLRLSLTSRLFLVENLVLGELCRARFSSSLRPRWPKPPEHGHLLSISCDNLAAPVHPWTIVSTRALPWQPIRTAGFCCSPSSAH